jgi:hypothetical protein
VVVAAPVVAQVAFESAAGEVGLVAVHAPDADAMPEIQEWMTGGLAVGDYNGDGYADLFCVGGGLAPDKLFINDGNGHFTDEAADWGVAALHMSNGASAADYDGDGWIDIYVTSFGPSGGPAAPGYHRLYHNNGNGSFTNVAGSAGVNYSSFSAAGGYGSAWGDYDLDGDLDLFVTTWRAKVQGNRLYKNEGDGTFTDATTDALGGAAFVAWGFQPAFADMNGDLYPELLISADFDTSRYFVNNGDGTFDDFTVPSGTGLDENGMGQTIGDVDRDEILDWYVTSVHQANPPAGIDNGNMLYMGIGNDVYEERSEAAGCNDGGWGWGTIALDVDHDGWLDLIEVNGRPAAQWANERAKLFHNLGEAIFEEIAEDSGFDCVGEGRGVVYLDAEQDGDLDVAVCMNESSLEYYRNLTGTGAWLQVELDTASNPLLAPNGFGARVEAVVGSVTHVRILNGSPSYLSTSEHVVHFGLDNAVTVDELRVIWPRGQVTTLQGVAVDQRLVIPGPVPGDLDADGVIDVSDLLELLALWGPVTDAHDLRADPSGDGVVGVDDLLIVLAGWSG